MQNALRINDIFFTFQGEGSQAGRRALFLRLPFCNLKCSWCDTEFNSFEKFHIKMIENFIEKEPETKFIVFTGGEPTINKDFTKLVKFFHEKGFCIAVESNGTGEVSEEVGMMLNVFTVSPKKDTIRNYKKPYYYNPKTIDKISRNHNCLIDFKYVVDDEFDFSTLEHHKRDVYIGRKNYYLSPEWNNMPKNLKKIEKFIVKNQEWRISLQTHKWCGFK